MFCGLREERTRLEEKKDKKKKNKKGRKNEKKNLIAARSWLVRMKEYLKTSGVA